MAILHGHKEFRVYYYGVLLFRESELTLVDSVYGVPTPFEEEEMWAHVYQISNGPMHLVHYGEDIEGRSYIRFATSLEDAKKIADNWIENWEI